jgi:hypothetical protein
MRASLLFLALSAVVAAPALASAQGYYQNTLRRNPFTGRWEVVPTGQVDARSFGPYRDQRSFYADSYNPYDGTLSRSGVRRNPYTGRLEVMNEYINPYTGARVIDGTRFNPLTGRYETVTSVQPPTNPIPSNLPPPPDGAVEAAPPTGDSSGQQPSNGRTTARKPIVKPKIIENQFPTNPPPR